MHNAKAKAQMEMARAMAAAAVAPPTEHSHEHSHTHSQDEINTYTHHSSFAQHQPAQRNEFSKQQQTPSPVLVEKEGRPSQPPAAAAGAQSNLLALPVSTQRKRCASETFISACGSSSLMLPPANGALPRTSGQQTDAKAASTLSNGGGGGGGGGGGASQIQHLSLPHLSSPSTSCTAMGVSARSMVESMASPTSNKIELGVGGAHGGSGLSARGTLQDAAPIIHAAQAQMQAQTAMTGLSLLSSPDARLSPRAAGAALALAAEGSSLCMSNLSLAEGGVVPALLLPWAVQQQRARALERGMEDLLSHPPLFLSLAEQPAGPGANPPNPPTRVQPLAVPSWSPFNSPRLAPGQQAPMLRRKLNTLALRHINMVLEGMSAAQVLSLSCHTKMQPPNFLTALNNPGACTTVAPQRLRPPTGVQATPTSSPMPFASLPPAALLASPQPCAPDSQMGSMSPIATPASLQTAPNSVVLAASASPNGAGVSFISLDSHGHGLAQQQCAPASENLAQLEYRLSLLVAKSEWKSARISQPGQKLSLFGRDAYRFQGEQAQAQAQAQPHPDEYVPLLGEGGALRGCQSVFGFLKEINGASAAVATTTTTATAVTGNRAPTSTLLCSVTASASPMGSPVSSRASPTPGAVQDAPHYLSTTCPSPMAQAAAATAAAPVPAAQSTPVRCGRRSAQPASTSTLSSQQSTPPAAAASAAVTGASRSRRPSSSLQSLSLSPDGAAASRIRVHVGGDSDEESSPEVGRRRVKAAGTTPPERTALVVPARASPSAAGRRAATAATVASALDASDAPAAVQHGQRERSLVLAQRPHAAAAAGKLPGQADDSTVAAHARMARIDAC